MIEYKLWSQTLSSYVAWGIFPFVSMLQNQLGYARSCCGNKDL